MRGRKSLHQKIKLRGLKGSLSLDLNALLCKKIGERLALHTEILRQLVYFELRIHCHMSHFFRPGTAVGVLSFRKSFVPYRESV